MEMALRSGPYRRMNKRNHFHLSSYTWNLTGSQTHPVPTGASALILERTNSHSSSRSQSCQRVQASSSCPGDSSEAISKAGFLYTVLLVLGLGCSVWQVPLDPVGCAVALLAFRRQMPRAVSSLLPQQVMW